ncbi:TATA binding protein-associated phosphoprotein [Hyaloraphidium curvatum]|nr:TATA binding protein-associated phosphoprotein [Hyaloraphidium curvatum]
MSDDEFEKGGGPAEEELSLPKATVTKLIQEMLPPNITCTKETRDMLIECCTEFVHLLTMQANSVCDKEQKKTITGDHIMTALEELGFGEYVPELQEVYADHQKTLKESQGKASSRKLDKSGLSQEELLAQQQLLFQQARAAFNEGQSSFGAPPAASSSGGEAGL